MKAKTIHLVGPFVLLAAFLGYFLPAQARLEAVLADRREKAAAEATAQEAQRVATEAAAARAHEVRLEQAKREAAEKRARRTAEQQARAKAINAELAEAHQERAARRGEVVVLETRLTELVAARRGAEAALFATRRETERRQIERRILDLQIQRGAEVLAETISPGALGEGCLFPRPYRDSFYTGRQSSLHSGGGTTAVASAFVASAPFADRTAPVPP
jgi:hypothetical protein